MDLQDVQFEQIALRDVEMHQLRSSLLNKDIKMILLYGLRYIGKTSLLHAFTQELYGGDRYTPIYFDLAANPNRSAKQLQSDLAEEIISIVNGKPTNKTSSEHRAYGLKHIQSALDGWQSGAKLLIAIDELNVLGLNAFGNVFVDGRTASFLGFLAELGRTESVKFIAATDGVEPAQVIDTLNSKIGKTELQQLSLLDRDSAVRLIRKSYDTVLNWSDEGVVEYLWAITHGHPYLIRHVTFAIYDSAQKSYAESNERVKVTLPMVGSAITECIQPTAEAPLWVWEQLPLEVQTVASAIAGFGPGQVLISDLRVELANAKLKNASAELAISNLDLALDYLRTWHLVEGTKKDYRFTVELFRRWIAKHHPLIGTAKQSSNNTSTTSFLPESDGLFTRGYDLDEDVAEDTSPQPTVGTQTAPNDAAPDAKQETTRPPRAPAVQPIGRDYDSYEPNASSKRASPRQLIAGGVALLMISGAIFIPNILGSNQSGELGPVEQDQTSSATFLEVTPTNVDAAVASNIDFDYSYSLIDEIPNSDQVLSVAFSQDDTHMAAGLANGTIAIWNLADTSRIEQILVGHTAHVSTLMFDRQNSQRLISGSHDRTIRVWELGTTNELLILEGHSDQVSSVAIAPNSTMLASASADGTIRLWNSETGVLLRAINTQTPIHSLSVSPSGSLLASGNTEGTTTIWKTETGQPEQDLNGHTGSVSAVAFLGNETEVVTGSVDGTVRLWDLSREVDSMMIAELQFNVAVHDIAVSENGRFVASAMEASVVQIWDREIQSILPPLASHTAAVRTVTYSPNGDYLASGSEDGILRRWQIVQDGN